MARSLLEQTARRPGAVGVASALALTALLTAGACAPKAAGPLLLHPVPPDADGYRLEQGAVVFEVPELAVSARPWDWRLVEEEFRAAGGPNPFGDGEGETGRFLFIRVRLENRSRKTLVFNPLRAALLPEGQSPIVPLEYSDLFMFAAEEPAPEARGRAFSRTCFDKSLTLRGGEHQERYLVFRSPGREGEMTLVLDELWLGTTAFDLRFPFEAFPGR